jgi:signal transduction histidine kinase
VLIYSELLENMLVAFGINLQTATTLEEGLSLSAGFTFDAVLLDLGLPDSHGLETFTRFCKANPELPVVILSGLDDEALAAKAVQLGAQDYLVKGPYLMRGEAGKGLLVRAIRYAIERHQNQKDLRHERDMLETRVAERTAQLEQELVERRRVEKALRQSEAKLRQYNERLRYLAAKLVSAQEDERRRLSMELHDEAGQALTALKVNLALVRSSLPPGDLPKKMDDAIHITECTMDQLRSLAHNLRPPALDTVGLNQTLHDYCQRVARQSDLHVTYQGLDVPDLPGHCQISLYRVLQEALTNVIKHAEARRVQVRLRQEDGATVLDVQDDGRGFNQDPAPGENQVEGIGLLGIKERMEALGGKVEIETQPEKGTRLVAQMPF